MPRLNRVPFLLGDLTLVGVALIVYAHGRHWPFGPEVGLMPWEAWVVAACFFLGAGLGILPSLLEYRAWTRASELDRIDTALRQVKNVDQIGRQISSATAGWQAIQDDAGKAVRAAEDLAQRMTVEGKAFQDFLQRANDSERAHLRLEVEKLRRAEADWLQTLVRILDHVWALYQAAVRSGKVNLVEQLSHFQRACRDAAQRVGLVPFVANRGDKFDPELHQPARPPAPELTDFIVSETVATGFRFQGQPVRKALVLFELTGGAAAEAPVDDREDVAGMTDSEPRPSNQEQTEFGRDLASDFRESADTEFVQALAGEDIEPEVPEVDPWTKAGFPRSEEDAPDRPGAA